MERALLETLGRIAGIGGLALGVFLLLFREVIRKNVFPKLSDEYAYRLIRQFMYLTFGIAILGILAWAYVATQTHQQVPATRNDAVPNVAHKTDNQRLPEPRPGPKHSLTVLSSPTGADIFLNGKYFGKTNRTIELAEGKYQFELRKPNFGIYRNMLARLSHFLGDRSTPGRLYRLLCAGFACQRLASMAR